MKVMKYELVRVIDKLKSLVQRNDNIPSLSGILVENGYLTASNTEITMQVKLEAATGTPFILPMKSFDLIKQLPDGELEITCDEANVVTIRMDKIRNSYKSFPAESFAWKREAPNNGGILLPGQSLVEALSRVLFAASDKETGMMGGVYLEADGDSLNVVALDGHVIAWEKIQSLGESDLKIIVPRQTIKKLVSMDMDNDVTVTYDKSSAVFQTEEYTIFTRLIAGSYFAYQKMFNNDKVGEVDIDRKAFSAALNRARSITDESKPVILDIDDTQVQMSIADSLANYMETIPVNSDFTEPLKIGFDSKLLIEASKVIMSDIMNMRFIGSRAPVYITGQKQEIKILVLPVNIR